MENYPPYTSEDAPGLPRRTFIMASGIALAASVQRLLRVGSTLERQRKEREDLSTEEHTFAGSVNWDIEGDLPRLRIGLREFLILQCVPPGTRLLNITCDDNGICISIGATEGSPMPPCNVRVAPDVWDRVKRTLLNSRRSIISLEIPYVISYESCGNICGDLFIAGLVKATPNPLEITCARIEKSSPPKEFAKQD